MELVNVTTSDGIRLDGVLETRVLETRTPQLSAAADNEVAAPKTPVDAWLCLHGTGSNFYGSTLLASLAPRLLRSSSAYASSAAVLRANTRGHDLVCTGNAAKGKRFLGAAFERVDESPLDVHAWVNLLQQRGFTRLGLLGHSLGAVKAIYTMAQNALPSCVALVAISPPRLSHSYYLASPRGEEFRQTFATAMEHVAKERPDELMLVRFPLTYLVSAAAYVDRYGTAEHYNVLGHVERIHCPTLISYGSSEMQSEVAFRGMPEALAPLRTESNQLQVAVIAGADHNYTAAHDSLFARIESWLRRPPA